MDSRQIELRAAEWLAKRDGDDWGEADQLELRAWLDASTAHYAAYLRLEAACEESFRLRALGAGVKPGVVPAPGEWRLSPFFELDPPGAASVQRPQRAQDIGKDILASKSASRHRVKSVPRLALAASLLVVIATGIGYFWPASSDYKTPIGVTASVPMSDGSHVVLNTNSEIRLAIDKNRRVVQLERGEAFFEVVKDPSRPFVVQMGNKRVIAVGTEFSVRRVGNDIRVAVTEGAVKVEEEGASGARADSGLPPSNSVLVGAGGIAHTSGSGVLLQQEALPEVEESLSWRSGYVVFRDTPLGEAVAELNRYNARKIVIVDPAVAAFRLSGKFRPTNFDDFVRVLEDAFPVHVHADDEQVVLSAK